MVELTAWGIRGLLAAALVCVAGCGVEPAHAAVPVVRSQPEPPPAASAPSVQVGAPCKPDGVADKHELGQPFCLGSTVHPHGYLTLACRGDTDCPGDTRCASYSGHCLAPCEDDSSCAAPEKCTPLGDGMRACMCLDCAR